MAENFEDAVQAALGREIEQLSSFTGPTHIYLAGSHRFSDRFELYRRAFSALKLPDMFVPLELPPIGGAPDIDGLRSLMGLFRSTPALQTMVISGSFQRLIGAYLDRIETRAAEIGFVNIVRKRGEEVVGENIDGEAFALGVKNELGLSFARKSAVFFGCGGISTAVALQLAPQLQKVALVDTHFERADELAQKLRNKNPRLKLFLSDRSEELNLRDYEIFYNGTGLGRQGFDLNACLLTPLHAFDELPKYGYAFDASYTPWETAFLRRFMSSDFETLNGFSHMVGFSSIHLSMITTRQVEYSFVQSLTSNTHQMAVSPWQ